MNIKFEYNAINNPTFLGDRLLNKLGEEGWELVSHAYNSNTCDHFYTFKREKVSTQDPAHYESREITVEDIHKIHREMMEKERTDEMERTYGVVIDEIVDNKDFTGMDDNGNPTFRYKGIYYTLDKSFKKILEERIERPPHWWWDALERK